MNTLALTKLGQAYQRISTPKQRKAAYEAATGKKCHGDEIDFFDLSSMRVRLCSSEELWQLLYLTAKSAQMVDPTITREKFVDLVTPALPYIFDRAKSDLDDPKGSKERASQRLKLSKLFPGSMLPVGN
jgi:hypothetical protein